MLSLLRDSRTIWALFAATIALTIGFQLATPLAGGTLLDTSSALADSEGILQLMSAEQKRAHLWITALLDVPFPFVYGGLLAGLCLRHGGKYALWLATPAFLVIPVDLIENAIQAIALLGNESLLGAKEVLTPAKYMLVVIAAIVALGSLGFRLCLAAIKKFS